MPPMNLASARVLKQLARHESRNVTYQSPDGSWPIVWQRARGVHVWDVEGRKYLDLTAAFGVAGAGHAHPAVVAAGRKQLGLLPHAMGDVHPHSSKGALCQALSRITFERWSKPRNGIAKNDGDRRGKTILGCSGSDAVEAALKTALLATSRRGIVAFDGAYHGLGYGALNATHRRHFRGHFETQLGGFVRFAPFPEDSSPHRSANHSLAAVRAYLETETIGAVLIEPVQARGGIRIPPPGFLQRLSALCRRYQTLLVLDEIYTGFGRTGAWFACEHDKVVPDLICLGKAMAGGFPISACVGRADLMDQAWPPSEGEAIHTSTFLGHPVGCAMALACIQAHRDERLPAKASAMGRLLLGELKTWPDRFPALRLRPRVLGLMAGLEIRRLDGSPSGSLVLELVQALLQRGLIVLPEGQHGEVLGLTPPLIVTAAQLRGALEIIETELRNIVQKHSARGGSRS